MRRPLVLLAVVPLLLAGAAAGRPAAAPVIAAVGDIACDPADQYYNGGLGTDRRCRHKYTSDLVVGRALAAVLALGDNQYENGAYDKYVAAYDPTWGRVKGMTYPARGNHDGPGYFTYYGAVAGTAKKAYYSFDVGSWHLISIDSRSCVRSGCGEGTEQEAWLRADLEAHPVRCTLAFWHHPLFSSGADTMEEAMEPIWRALQEAGADLVLAGHAHNYQRFAPQTSTGEADPVRGIREFVVGTGGKSHTAKRVPAPNLELQNSDTYGVLLVTLRAGSYRWKFVPEAGGTFTDAGSADCR